MKDVICYVCLTIIGFSALAPSMALAQNNGKQTPARSVDVKKVFGYYDIYLRLPPLERDGFRMSYILNRRDGSPRPALNYALGNTRIPIQIAQNGKVVTMPDANMFSNGKVEIPAGQSSLSISMNLEAVVPLARTISTSDAANPLNDYAAALRRAGPLGLIAPKLTGITFKGVANGDAVFADGRRAALETSASGVVFRPLQPTMRGATALVFPAQPIAAEFAR
jgi:hypothetical protein